MKHRWRTFTLRFFCGVMSWHKISYGTAGFDGCSLNATCARCGYVGLVDSQGNLF